MRAKYVLNVLSMIIVLLFGCVAIAAQQTTEQHKSLSYGFVSPNVREGLKLNEAISEMSSVAEWNFMRRALNLRCVVRTEIRVARSLGSWSDGAENATVLRLLTDEPTVRYLASRLGRDADQKAVLYFHSQAQGSATLYILRPTKGLHSFQKIITLLDRAGIKFRTLVPTRTNILIYLVDTQNEMAPKVINARRLLKARVNTITGNAAFIGDDSERDKAKMIFTREMEEYETKHPSLPTACEEK